ncbi:ABC transporter permease [Nocardioides baekrokdamisoli]|uniref:ABC transporter permease n=1 Tax=Nocardioides baekrokdamisoli TaxID=1804624 RepID=A0A3G9IJP6_9ACTN|nr:ABC transporter permease subunit [Nocardioides baekrokdamisoli]BBH18392.1 ABC transporter permease [Nocardioides baekrokdamisoli]
MSTGTLTFPRILRAEWIKFRTLRSTWITYAVALVLSLGIGALVSFGHGQEVHNHPDRHELFDPVIFTQTGVFLAQLAIGVMGVMSVTGEYATGMIRASMTAVPKRTPVLLAKVVIFALVTVIVSLVMTFGAFFIGQAILAQWNMNGSLSSPGAVRGLLGATYYVTIVGLIGLGLGFLIRNTAGAIASVVGLVFVLPIIVSFLPSSWSQHIGKFLPSNIAGHLIETVGTSDSVLTRPVAVAVLAAYALLAIVLGWLVMKRKDV